MKRDKSNKKTAASMPQPDFAVAICYITKLPVGATYILCRSSGLRISILAHLPEASPQWLSFDDRAGLRVYSGGTAQDLNLLPS